jgi:hypothetical protein
VICHVFSSAASLCSAQTKYLNKSQRYAFPFFRNMSESSDQSWKTERKNARRKLSYKAEGTGEESELAKKLLSEFDALATVEQQRFFVNRWQLNSKNKNLAAIQQDYVKVAEKAKGQVGWFTKYKVAEFQGILPGVPNYEALVDACVADLPSKDHENPKLAALEVKMYHYCHKEMFIGGSKTKAFIVESNQAMNDDQQKALLQQMSKACCTMATLKDQVHHEAVASGDPSAADGAHVVCSRALAAASDKADGKPAESGQWRPLIPKVVLQSANKLNTIFKKELKDFERLTTTEWFEQQLEEDSGYHRDVQEAGDDLRNCHGNLVKGIESLKKSAADEKDGPTTVLYEAVHECKRAAKEWKTLKRVAEAAELLACRKQQKLDPSASDDAKKEVEQDAEDLKNEDTFNTNV